MTMQKIQALTEDYAEQRQVLSARVQALNDELADVKARHLPGIRRAVASSTDRFYKLQALLQESAALFAKPKTQVFAAIRVGFRKAVGKIHWDDADLVVKLIHKHHPEKADVLIRTEEKPVKSALGQLTVAELKRIGVEAAETGEVIVIKPVDSEVDKIVAALLEGAEDEARQAEAA